MEYSYDHRTARKAPKLSEGKWELKGKTYPSKEAAITAAAKSLMIKGGTVKIWERKDPLEGIEGTNGYSITIKELKRKAPK